MKKYEQVSAFILCGGSSSRMGRPKGRLEFGGEPLINRIARTVEPLVSSVSAVGKRDDYTGLGLEVIEDIELAASVESETKAGPLVGIATALKASRTEWNLILACDLPYLTGEWLNWLLRRGIPCDTHIVMPRSAAGLEPLAALYRKECAEPIMAALHRGIRKVVDATAQMRVELVSEEEWQNVDLDRRVLRNMNTLQEYEKARMSLARA
jgi:molybdopterin-guanine dinucleotide biosynthesis protein A